MGSTNAIRNIADPVGVHIVGSVPLPSETDVFTTLTSTLPGRLKRVPDGETGERLTFTIFQTKVFAAAPQALRQYDAGFNSIDTPIPSQSEVDAAVATIRESGPPLTHYETNAINSYKSFKALQDAGKIPSGVKFQVSLPTPINVIVLTAEGYQAALEPLYEEQLLKALRTIEAEIPHSALSIQWDFASEFALLEGALWPHFKLWFSSVRESVIERVVRLVDAVSPDVEVGLHLCYGDIGHRHFFEPKDMAKLVDVANAVKEKASHPISYLHMPVPRDRDDSAYFEPLRELKLGEMELFLGLVHNDDLEGTRRRIAAARTVVGNLAFGVATECGMGRTPPDHLNSILEIAAAVAGPYEGQEP